MTDALATHRLFRTLPPSHWNDVLVGTVLPEPCLGSQGEDLLFSALTNAHVLGQVRLEGTPGAAKSPAALQAQDALVALAKRDDARPLALQALVRKGQPKLLVSNLELALRLSLTSVVKALLAHPSVTPESLQTFRSQPSAWHHQGLLAQAVDRDLVDLVPILVAKGWEANAMDPQGLGLVAQARTAAMIEALLAAGLAPESLEHPQLVSALTKRVKKAEVPAVLAAINQHTQVASVGDQVWHWLRSGKDIDPDAYTNDGRADGLKALQKRHGEWERLFGHHPEPMTAWRTELKHGTIKGTLTLPAMMARRLLDEPDSASFSFLQGHEQAFAGPAVVIEKGVTDLGAWALFGKAAHVFEDRNVDPDGSPGQRRYSTWVDDVAASLHAIEAQHSPQQWLAWRTETAATLSKRPTAALMRGLNPWFSEFTNRLESIRDDAGAILEAKSILDELEQVMSAGVAFHGGFVSERLEQAIRHVQPPSDETMAGAYQELAGQRDRLLLAALGNSARLKAHSPALGIPGVKEWTAQERKENPYAIFTPENLAHAKQNTKLTKLVELGALLAAELGAPGAEALRALVLDGQLPAAAKLPKAPRF